MALEKENNTHRFFADAQNDGLESYLSFREAEGDEESMGCI